MKTNTVAAVQWQPEVLNPKAGAEKAAEAIKQAAAEGAGLVVFPEVWLQGYPYFSGLSPSNPDYQFLLGKFLEAAIAIDDPMLQPVFDAAAACGCNVVLGLNERSGGSVYCTLLYIGTDGKPMGSQRKLMPTQAERLVWAQGDGSDIRVYDTAHGRLGGLNCFEHQMAPARYALCDLGCQVHASAWPGHLFLDGIIDASTRHLSHENGCFVIVAREVMSAAALPSDWPIDDSARAHFNTHGGSAIIAPGGDYLVPPVFDKETIVTAEIDLAMINVIKWFFDGTGHYARPDVFQMTWDKRRKKAVETIDDASE